MKSAGLPEILRALTSLARTGWMLRGVPPFEAETVASHSYASALIAFEMSVTARSKGLNVDPYRAAAEALIHDIAESVLGDITRTAGIDEAKKSAEKRAFMSLEISEEAKRLYLDFERGGSLEAVIARVSELLATYWKSLEYECRGYRVSDIKESTLKEALTISDRYNIRSLVEEYIERLRSGRACSQP